MFWNVAKKLQKNAAVRYFFYELLAYIAGLLG